MGRLHDGFSASNLLAGPTPSDGAKMSDPYADTNASVSGVDSVLVAVMDNKHHNSTRVTLAIKAGGSRIHLALVAACSA
jgi:hypothetical protein